MRAPLAQTIAYRSLVFLILSSLFALQSQSQVPDSQQVPPGPGSVKVVPDLTPQNHEQVAAYWTSETGWNTELQLRNNLLDQDLIVTPVVRRSDGAETALAAITIKPQEVKGIDLDASISAANAPQLVGTYGSIVLRYSSTSRGNLYATTMIRRTGHSIAFHIDAMSGSQDFQAGSREGVWWLPNDTTTDYLILTNQDKNTIPLVLSLFDANGKENRQSVTLGPNETVRYNFRELLQSAGLTGSHGGIKISASAHAGSLDTLHLLFDETANFSATLKMFDYNPNAKLEERDFAHTGVWTLRAPMLALSTPDPALAFPQGTTLHPQLLIRNAATKPADVILRFNWRTGSATGAAAGPALHLNPLETRRVDVAALQDGNTLPKDANWTTVTLTTKGMPNEVMAVAASYDDTLRYGAQTPFSDQLSARWEGGMWEFDPQHDSIITVGNGGTKSTQARFTIFYNQGTQRYDIEQTLQSDAQMVVDVGKLIQQQIPDKNGQTLPANLTSGSYEIRDLTSPHVGSLFEGKVIYDKMYGHVTYGCANCCGYYTPWLIYNPLGVPFEGQAGNGVDAISDCGGIINVTGDFYNGWRTANSSIASVNAGGIHTGVAIGTTSTTAWGRLPEAGRRFTCPLNTYGPASSDNVVTLTCPSSVTRGASATCSLNNAPTGATFSGWKFTDANSNIVIRSTNTGSSSWTGAMVISGTVSVTVTAGRGSTPLSARVNVANRNWHTNPASPIEVSNGTFYVLYVPPQPTGNFSGLGISNWRAAYGTISYVTIGDGGPNQGYTYFPSNFPWTNFDYRYEINPDLENTGSTFYTAQCGNYNATTNPSGFISGSYLLTETRRHEYNSSTESHYAFYSSAMNSSADNVGDYLEQQIAIPGASLSTFNSNVQSGITSRLNSVGTAASQEDPPWPVTYSETDVFLGNVNYAPYSACQ